MTRILGEEIQRARNAHGYSLRRLGALSGVSHTEIKRIEDGTRRQPAQPILVALAAPLHIPARELLSAAGYLFETQESPAAYQSSPPAVEALVRVPVVRRLSGVTPTHDEITGWEDISARELAPGRHLCFDLEDESMRDAHLPLDARVLVACRDEVIAGTLELVALEGGALVVRFVYPDETHVILAAANPRVPVQIYALDKARIIGAVIRWTIRIPAPMP